MSRTLLTVVVVALALSSKSSVHGSQSKLFEMASQHAEKTPLEEPVDALADVPEEEEVDVSSFFRELFDDSEEDDEEENSNRESRNLEVGDTNSQADSSTKSEEDRSVTDEATVAKTNSFVDALLRKVNAELRKKGDPLKVKLHKASKKNKSSKRNSGAGKGGSKKGKKNKKRSGAKNSKASKRNAGGKKKGGNKKGKKQGRNSKPAGESQRGRNKSERKNRNPRLLEIEEESNFEETESTELDETLDMKSQILSRSRREIDVELVDAAEDESDSEDSSLMEMTKHKENFRQSKDMDFSGRGLGMATRRAQNKKLSKDKKKGKGNRNGKRSNKKPKKASKKNPTSHAVITGVSTLQRRGNVQISQNAKSQRIVADFSLGPISVEVSRKFGGGDKRTARSFSPSLAGKIIIEVNKNGNAKVSKMMISPPKNVRTTGSLAKSDSKKKMKAKQERYMKTSIKRVTPKLSKKIKFAAQRVLSATSSAVRSN